MIGEADNGGMQMAGALPDDHPGVGDARYRARRAEIAAAAAAPAWQPGTPAPTIRYRNTEHEVWATVAHALDHRHRSRCADAYLDGKAALDLPSDRIPDLDEVSTRLRELSGFSIEPVPGLVPARDFYGKLATRVFMSTQYVRHESVPLYTPEPDIIHELVGHANLLANPTFADLHRAAGEASMRCQSDAAHDFFSRVFWFTLEFGVVWQGGEPKAYGAGLASSFGELEAFTSADIRPFDPFVAGTTDYDITRYQPVVFAVRSIDELADRLGLFLATFDDEAHARLMAAAA